VIHDERASPMPPAMRPFLRFMRVTDFLVLRGP
jgi:hypothetical protein